MSGDTRPPLYARYESAVDAAIERSDAATALYSFTSSQQQLKRLEDTVDRWKKANERMEAKLKAAKIIR